MGLVLSRLLRMALLLSLGAALGWVIGWRFGVPSLGCWGGALAGALLAQARDTARALRLIQWLQGGHEGEAPRHQGLWGELGYRIERALRALELKRRGEETRLEQFLRAIEASPNGVLLLDGDEQIVWCNSVAADHFGLDPVRDLRQRITNLVRMPAFVALLQNDGDVDAQTMTSPDGRAQLSVLVRRHGEGMRLILSADVTERQRAEAMRRDFVANVSHEIRTPLTVLMGFLETQSTLPLTEVERQRVLALMMQQTRRMQTLVADLLTLAQLEGSPRPPTDRWVPLARLVATVLQEGAALSAGRHRMDGPAADDRWLSATEIAGAESELHSAFVNLVTNAVRYTPEGGQVTVRVHAAVDGALLFEVRDSGIGIAKEHLPRLTERFYRVDGSRSRESGGTGLGLSIVKHVVQRHGGELQIDSEPGHGSTFRIRLPAGRIRSTATALPALAEPLAG